MKKEKLYFTRYYDQWRGKDLELVEDEKNVYDLYIQADGVIYPNEKSKGSNIDLFLFLKSKKTFVVFIKRYNVEIIVIGIVIGVM